MFTRENLEPLQLQAVDFIKKNKKCALFLRMGTGKTVSTLTAVSDFLDDLFITKVLVIAPLRVANNVWIEEVKNWEHLKHLKIKICTGTEKERLTALNSDADIYCINVENVPWLVENFYSTWKWDSMIIDESSTFKSHSSKRFKFLQYHAGQILQLLSKNPNCKEKAEKFKNSFKGKSKEVSRIKPLDKLKNIVLLTGTPSSNGYEDLWSQLWLIDKGERLGKNITQYRNTYFNRDPYIIHKWNLRTESDKLIREKIKDICFSVSQKTNRPDPKFINVYVDLPKSLKEDYKELEKEFILSLANNKNIVASNAATLSGKLLQFCNGALYDENKDYHVIHDLKIQALKEILEDNPTENFLVAYNFQSDLERLKKAFPNAVLLGKKGEEVKLWNEGKIRLLITHPKSSGHGLNLQHGGFNCVWFGLNWSLELYEQFNARLDRKGQKDRVNIIHLLLKNGLDNLVLNALKNKALSQNDLLSFLIDFYKK